MPFTDLLRITVFLAGGAATALAAITVVAVGPEPDALGAIFIGTWWLAALALGLWLGRPDRAADMVRDSLARAKTATSLPDDSPSRIAFTRLWPIGAYAVAAGGLGLIYPGIAVTAAGFALLASLAMRTHEAAVLGIEQRDGVKFYVVPNSALRPIELVRTPGLRSDRLSGSRIA
jgi:hypothetical protein